MNYHAKLGGPSLNNDWVITDCPNLRRWMSEWVSDEPRYRAVFTPKKCLKSFFSADKRLKRVIWDEIWTQSSIIWLSHHYDSLNPQLLASFLTMIASTLLQLNSTFQIFHMVAQNFGFGSSSVLPTFIMSVNEGYLIVLVRGVLRYMKLMGGGQTIISAGKWGLNLDCRNVEMY